MILILNECGKGLECELIFNITHNVFAKITKTVTERSILFDKFVRTRKVSDKETYEREVAHYSFLD